MNNETTVVTGEAPVACVCNEQAKALQPQDFPYLCPTRPGRVHCLCQKPGCHERIALDFGSLNKEQATKAATDIAMQPGECPGWHVEMSFWVYWQFESALKLLFPVGGAR